VAVLAGVERLLAGVRLLRLGVAHIFSLLPDALFCSVCVSMMSFVCVCVSLQELPNTLF